MTHWSSDQDTFRYRWYRYWLHRLRGCNPFRAYWKKMRVEARALDTRSQTVFRSCGLWDNVVLLVWILLEVWWYDEAYNVTVWYE